MYWANRALTIRPEQADASSIIGMIHFRRGEYERAVPFLEKFVRGASELGARDRADVRCHLAISLSYVGRHDEAMRVLRQAIQIDPAFAAPRLLLAQALSGFDESDEAAKLYRSVIALEPDNIQARVGYVRLVAREKGCRAASEPSREALERIPESAELLEIRAMLLATCDDEAIRDPRLAVATARKAAELTDYQDPAILSTWAVACAEDGQFARAVEILDRALELAERAAASPDWAPRLRQQRQMFQANRRLTDSLR